MGYEDKDFEIIKQKDGSLIEKVGSVETLYKRPFTPWSVEVEEITYSQTLYNPEEEESLLRPLNEKKKKEELRRINTLI